jgi:hypothetical protein
MKIRRFLAVALVLCMSQLTHAVDINVKLSMPNSIVATAGQTVTIPINLSNIQSAFSLDSFQLIVTYDNAFFDAPVTTGFKLGSLTTGLSYTGPDDVDTITSSLNIVRSNATNPLNLTSASNGSLMTFDIKVKSSAAAGTSGYLNFVATQGAANTEILTISGDPGDPDNIRFNPALTDVANQGRVSILPVPEPSTYVMSVIAFIVLAGFVNRGKQQVVLG